MDGKIQIVAEACAVGETVQGRRNKGGRASKAARSQKDRYVPVGLRALLWIARYVEHAREKLLLDSAMACDIKPSSP